LNVRYAILRIKVTIGRLLRPILVVASLMKRRLLNGLITFLRTYIFHVDNVVRVVHIAFF